MKYNNVQEYNTYLIDNKLDPNILDYVKEINIINNNIKCIDFIDIFIELVGNDTFCIPYIML